MLALSFPEVSAWCDRHGVQISPNGRLGTERPTESLGKIDLPHQPHQLPILVGHLLDIATLLDNSETMLWIVEWRIWNDDITATGIEALQRLRLSTGSSASVEDSPGQIFSPSEHNLAVASCLMPLLFGWDAYIVPASGEPAIFISHDEFFRVELCGPVIKPQVTEILAQWCSSTAV